MKKICLIVLVLMLTITPYFAQGYIIFTDIIGHWSEDNVLWASNDVKLFSGYRDGSFRPDEPISRAEYLTILNRLLHIKGLYQDKTIALENINLNYNDLNRDFWAYKDIAELSYYLQEYSTINIRIRDIFPGNTLAPNKAITRYEAAVLARSIIAPPINFSNRVYTDVSRDLRFYNELIELSNVGIITGYNDNTFRPSSNITRGEAATIINRLYNDLDYLVPNRLAIRPVNASHNQNTKPLFEVGISDSHDNRFIDAITSLEYISFVGYIPYNERHLYDLNPIETLWTLKNEDYLNIIGNNYYLLRYDKSLVKERSIELIREALAYYEASEVSEIDGLYEFLTISKDNLQPRELIPFMEKYVENTESRNAKTDALVMLIELYLLNNQGDKALSLSEDLLVINHSREAKAQLIMNHGYILYETRGARIGIEYLQRSWSELLSQDSYFRNNKNIEKEFISLIRQMSI